VSLSVFLSNFGFAGLLLFLVLALILMFNHFQKKAMNILGRLSSTYNDVETILVRITNSVEQINARLNTVENTLRQIAEAQEREQREISRMADGYQSQSQLSKAIELAREGASVSEIMLSTNLPEEEAEAIARFHRA